MRGEMYRNELTCFGIKLIQISERSDVKQNTKLIKKLWVLFLFPNL